MAKQKKQQLPKRKKVRFTSRFYTIVATFFIMLTVTFFLVSSNSDRIPNLHGWESSDVVRFAVDNHINIEFEFSYSDVIAPTLVISQSALPRTAIRDVELLIVEISKGIEVR